MDGIGFPERTLLVRRAAARLCLRLGWAPLHEVRLALGDVNGDVRREAHGLDADVDDTLARQDVQDLGRQRVHVARHEQPRVGLEEGLSRLVEWWRANATVAA